MPDASEASADELPAKRPRLPSTLQAEVVNPAASPLSSSSPPVSHPSLASRPHGQPPDAVGLADVGNPGKRRRLSPVAPPFVPAVRAPPASPKPSVTDQHTLIVSAVESAAEKVLGFEERAPRRGPDYVNDPVVQRLSRRRKELGTRLYGRPGRDSRNVRRCSPEEVAQVKAERNALVRPLRARLKLLRDGQAESVVKELQDIKEPHRFFALSRMLWAKTGPGSLVLEDDAGSLVHDPNFLIGMVEKFYSNFFQPEGMQPIVPFDPDIGCTPLEEPVMAAEVEAAARRLSNRKAPVIDGLEAELFKYGGRGPA